MKAPWFISGSIFLAVISLPFLQQILRFADWVASSAFGIFFVGALVITVLGALAFNMLIAVKNWLFPHE